MAEIEIALDETKSRLAVIDQNLEEVPAYLAERYGNTVVELALNYNNLKYVRYLQSALFHFAIT